MGVRRDKGDTEETMEERRMERGSMHAKVCLDIRYHSIITRLEAGGLVKCA